MPTHTVAELLRSRDPGEWGTQPEENDRASGRAVGVTPDFSSETTGPGTASQSPEGRRPARGPAPVRTPVRKEGETPYSPGVGGTGGLPPADLLEHRRHVSGEGRPVNKYLGTYSRLVLSSSVL